MSENIAELLGAIPTPSQSEKILDWTMQALSTRSAMDQAVCNFHSITDREIAAKAAYKAMGLDPTQAPTFGWNMSERPRVNQTVINTASEQQPGLTPPSGGVGSLLKAAVLSILAVILLFLGVTYGSQMFNQQEMTRRIEEVQAILQRKPDESSLQFEICEEFDSDPAFKEEIKADLTKIAEKISEHRKKRLGQ